MKTLQDSRFMLTVRKYYIEQKKSILTLCASYIGFAIFLGIWMASLELTPGDGLTIFYGMASGFGLAVFMSMTFKDLSTKEGRLSTLMSPATPAEKFWPRVVAALFGGIALCIAAFYMLLIAYHITLLCTKSMPWSWSWLPGFYLIHFDNESVAAFGALISVFLFNEALFLLGAVLWPKRSFIKTLGIFAVIMIALNIFTMGIMQIVGDIRIGVEDIKLLPAIWIFNTVTFLISSGMTYLAYYKFKNTQVVK